MRNPENTLLVLAIVGSALGCGDNSKECGPGTVDNAGECVPAAGCGTGTKRDEETGACVPDGTVVCSNGTVFDPLTGRCAIDPSACRDGTVLINNACVDPTAGLTVDVQEGPEPNGLGILEPSGAQAGTITLKQPGSTFVIHGSLAPWRDADNDTILEPDVDTYVVTTAAPVLLNISADGVHGVTAGFVMVAQVAPATPLASWKRWSLRLAGDTSRRQIYLPAAGTYRLAIADTRTLGEYLATGTAGSAPTGDYYVSITDAGPPALMPLPASSFVGNLPADSLLFFAPAPGTGITQASLTMASPAAQASVVVMVNGMLRGLADETSQPARVMTGGLASGDTTFVVVDYVVDTAPPPTTFSLSVNTTNL